ncbi:MULTISPECIES: DsbA family protein [unclassified Desulfovibrio]|uniref:DsbA family protein n=1 Tax=unclassified Desulfovibrio TaxID=2593640 RepID=UPI0013ED3385|nr:MULTISPECIES: DsbA family protein [unclassified Desulfovibrio]
MDKQYTVEVWNDTCVPHCYTGEVVLLRAIADLGLRERVKVRLRAFELDPGFPPGKTIEVPRCVAKKYGCSVPEALEKIAAAEAMARKAGIDMKFAGAVFCNTRSSHRVLKYAASEFGDATALQVNLAFLGAYFTRNLVLEGETLVCVAAAAGLPAEAVRDVVLTNKFEEAVLEDEREAARRGIFSIPCFDFNGKFLVNGAIGLRGFRQALTEMLA